jgi:hypothetical protein
MFPILCDICKKTLDFNYTETLENYLPKVDYINNSLDYVCSAALAMTLMYDCVYCDKKFKYSFEDLNNKLRESVVNDVKKYRKIYVFKNILTPTLINPDNGIDYCGLCDGADNLGNCYIDVIKICPFVLKNEA